MDADQRELTRTIDPALLGARLKRARQRAGLTQGQTAEGCSSTAYVSRIEAGQRRPAPDLLETLAERLGCSLEDLLAPDERASVVDHEAAATFQLQLDYAELSLRSGDAAVALAGVEKALDTLGQAPVPSTLRRQARFLRAQAQGSAGDLNAAILSLEDLAGDGVHDLLWLRALTLLSGYFQDSGDLARSIDVGDRAEELIGRLDLQGTTEAVQLALTVAVSHMMRGDVNHAARVCSRAVEQAESSDSVVARASAYWNSSVVECEQGNIGTALQLTQRALALQEVTEDAASLARLRSHLGMLQLRMDPPEVDSAMANLTRSEQELEWARSTEFDRVFNRLTQARGHYLSGKFDLAHEMAEQCAISMTTDAPLIAADARVLQGRVAAGLGDRERTVAHYRDAVLLLSSVGADRGAAELWFELGSLLEQAGELAEALDAYRRAAACTGLRSSVESPARDVVQQLELSGSS